MNHGIIFIVGRAKRASGAARSSDVVDQGSFSDLKLGLGGATGSGNQKVLAGVDQVFFPAEFEDSFIGGLDLEIAVPGGGFGVFDVEGPQAGFPEVGLEDLTSLAVVNLGQLETMLEFSRREELVLLILVDGQDVVSSRSR